MTSCTDDKDRHVALLAAEINRRKMFVWSANVSDKKVKKLHAYIHFDTLSVKTFIMTSNQANNTDVCRVQ